MVMDVRVMVQGEHRDKRLPQVDRTMQGPGLLWILPFFDVVSAWINQRTITTGVE
jgi:hypothetical protein